MTSNILYDGIVVQVTCSLWSGKARLSRDDLDPVTVSSLPPETLTSLGSKQLIDPTLLKPLTAIKSRMFREMNVLGCKFLNGWFVAPGVVDEAKKVLDTLRNEYNNNVQAFLYDYEVNTDTWVSQFPEWEAILRPALPSSAAMQRKFNFSYQMFKIQPLDRPGNGDNTKLAVSELYDASFNEVAAMLREIRERAFTDDRESFSHKTFNSFKPVFEKMRNISFLNPRITALRELLLNLTSTYINLTDNRKSMQTFGKMLDIISSPAVIGDICDKYNDGEINLDDLVTQTVGLAADDEDQQQEEQQKKEEPTDRLQEEETPFTSMMQNFGLF